MSDVSLVTLLWVFVTFFAAGLVKGVTGMGLPTVAMGLLGAVMSPLAAASLLIAPSFVTNVWQLMAGPRLGALAARLWPMLLAIALGTVLGAAWIARGDAETTTGLLGIALALYAGVTLFGRQCRVPPRMERALSPLVGGATGLVTGATGVFVIPAVPYLQALNLPKNDLVQALGLSFTASTVALAFGLGAHGAFRADEALLSALAVLPALGGMWAGQRVRDRISPAAFRRGFLIALLLLGCEMAARPLY
ncbi:sulfite exporter TauE/SafE family protein [Methylopila musalis]|uniref:Probable membrane transporter protein n=1 Tax=Methylopila musalis TaxID=1134781 RepID=A0ABW3Z2A6_9HYPH